MIEQATCPHGRKIDNRPTALKNMTKCHCCGMKIAPAYRTLCAQCEDTETMIDTKITITPEEAAALWERFGKDRNALCLTTPCYEMEAFILAIARERERCAKILEDYYEEVPAWQDRHLLTEGASKIRGEE